MKRKAFALVIAAVLLVAAGIGGTFAYFTATQSITNTFTVGNVRIRLYEGTKETPISTLSFISVPGKRYNKNPTIEVLEKSEDCYLFFEVIRTPGNETNLQYDLNVAEWMPYNVPNDSSRLVYVRKVEEADTPQEFPLLQNNSVSVPATATALRDETLGFHAYAVQRAHVNNANEAWDILFQ